MKTIIQNGIVVTMDQQMQVWDHGYVIIDGTKIVETGPESELELKKAALARVGENWQEKDARRGIIMPGMVNTHSHLGMIPFRGLGDDCKDRLRVFLLPMESQAMDAELAAASARYGICELLLSGVTTVLDMYYFEEKVAHIMDQMGIRGIAGEHFWNRKCRKKTWWQQEFAVLKCEATANSVTGQIGRASCRERV